MRVFSDPSVEQELADFFTYEYPGARFTPQYKARLWDGKVRLYDLLRKTIYIGLLDYIEQFCIRNGYELVFNTPIATTNKISQEIIEQFVRALKLPEKIEIRDYQLDAIHRAVDKDRTLLLSPTGSGKSFIIYSVLRWHINAGRKAIIVVPTTSLVEQLHADFKDYSSVNNWNVDRHVQKLYSGFSKEFDSNVLITTWQSLGTKRITSRQSLLSV
jgi:superfamily II DNA or RNA helicase